MLAEEEEEGLQRPNSSQRLGVSATRLLQRESIADCHPATDSMTDSGTPAFKSQQAAVTLLECGVKSLRARPSS